MEWLEIRQLPFVVDWLLKNVRGSKIICSVCGKDPRINNAVLNVDVENKVVTGYCKTCHKMKSNDLDKKTGN